MNNDDHINGWMQKLELCEMETSINHIVALLLYPLLCVVCEFMFLIISLCAIMTEAIPVGVRRRTTIVLVAVSYNSIWKSRLLCEYHLRLFCVSV